MRTIFDPSPRHDLAGGMAFLRSWAIPLAPNKPQRIIARVILETVPMAACLAVSSAAFHSCGFMGIETFFPDLGARRFGSTLS